LRTKLYRSLVLILAISAILAISSPHASAEAVKNSIILTKLADKSSEAPRNFQATESIRPAPELVIYDAEDKPLAISAFKGRGIVLNFWATWCAPCVKEMPDLDRLHALLKKEGIDVLAVSVDRNALRLAKKFYKINEIRHMPVLIDKNRKVLRRLSIRGLPTTVLINPEGMEVGRIVGAIEWNSPENVAFLRRLLAPKK
jgi:thiol-disulfide isomerase/thioredoxin